VTDQAPEPLKREHDQLLADHREIMIRVANLRDDLNGANARLVEVDNQLQAAIDEFRAFKQHAEAEFARLAGETEADKTAPPGWPGVTGWVHTDGTACDEYLASPASTPPGGYWCTTHQMYVRHPGSPAPAARERLVELAALTADTGDPQTAVQYGVQAPGAEVAVYGDQEWVKGAAAAGDLGSVTMERDVRISYGPWRPVTRKAAAECDGSGDCPGVVMWHWRPPSHPDQIVELCDEHAAGKDLSDLVDLRSIEVPS